MFCFDLNKEIAQAESRDHDRTSRDRNCHQGLYIIHSDIEGIKYNSNMSLLIPSFNLRQSSLEFHGNVAPDITVGPSPVIFHFSEKKTAEWKPVGRRGNGKVLTSDISAAQDQLADL